MDTLISATLPKCSICLGNISPNCVAITKCGHMFCKNCLSQSMRFTNKCAICRSIIKLNTISLVSITNQGEQEQPICPPPPPPKPLTLPSTMSPSDCNPSGFIENAYAWRRSSKVSRMIRTQSSL